MTTERVTDLPELEEQVEEEPQDLVDEDVNEEPQVEEEPDYQQLAETRLQELETLRQERDRLEEARRSERIQALTAKQRDERSDRMEGMMKDLLLKVDNGELSVTEATPAIREGVRRVETEIENTEEVSRLLGEIETIHKDMESSMESMDQGSQELEDVRNRWQEAESLWSQGRYSEARSRVGHAQTTLSLVQERQKGNGRRKASPAAMSLNDQSNRGERRAVGASDQATWDAYGRGEITWSKRVEEAGRKLSYLPS